MHKALQIGIVGAAIAATAFGLYYFNARNDRFDTEEAEIQTFLEGIYKNELAFSGRTGRFTEDIDMIGDLPETDQPTFVGLFPACGSGEASATYAFLGSAHEKFKAEALKLLDDEVAKGKCSDFAKGFLGFAAQNLDEDSNFEFWSVDENGEKTVLLDD